MQACINERITLTEGKSGRERDGKVRLKQKVKEGEKKERKEEAHTQSETPTVAV